MKFKTVIVLFFESRNYALDFNIFPPVLKDITHHFLIEFLDYPYSPCFINESAPIGECEFTLVNQCLDQFLQLFERVLCLLEPRYPPSALAFFSFTLGRLPVRRSRILVFV